MDKQISWSAPEYHYYEKGPRWYWGLIAIAAIIVVIALFQKNFLFAIFTVLAAILLGIWGTRTPRTFTFTLSEAGLDIGGKKFYPFDAFSGFSVISAIPESDTLGEIVLREKGVTGSWVKVIVGKDQLSEIHATLAEHLPESEHQASIAEHIAKILRF